MFRLVPACKGRQISRLLPSIKALVSTAAAALVPVSNGNGSKEINFDLYFRSCYKVDDVKRVHALLVASGRANNVFLYAKLVNLYAFTGDVSLAHRVFVQIREKDVFVWNSMTSAFVRNGSFREAIDCFNELCFASNLSPDFYTFPPVIKACGNLVEGSKIHSLISKLGFEIDVYVAASLIHMYTRFGFVGDARKLFDDMPARDRGLWNAMISGYCQNGNATEALDIMYKMRSEGVDMDAVTIASIMPVCPQLGNVLHGMFIHLYVIKHGLEFELFVANALIDMYAKFGRLTDSQKIFDQMIVRDLVSWNSIIAAYEGNRDAVTARLLFDKMQDTGIEPDSLTLVSLASIVVELNDLRNSKSLHGYIMRRGWFSQGVLIGNALVDMYAKMGSTHSARSVFDDLPVKDVISWNTLITGYAQNGFAGDAIELYRMMGECKGIVPNQGTWVSVIPAYSHVGALQQGMRIHGLVIKNSLYSDIFVSTCLIDMYGKCGKLDDALELFYEAPRRSSVPWNAIISCHSVHGHGKKALDLFKEMRSERVKPDHVTFVSLLSACSHSGLVSEGEWCYYLMQEEYGIKPSLKHCGCMVDLYGRAGQLEKAYNFIANMPVQPDASMWGALLGACRVHGNIELGKYASERLFEVDPENVGYYVLLSNMYANAGKWEGVSSVRSVARDKGLRKTPGWTSIQVSNNIHVFYTGGQTHPKSEEIYRELRELTAKAKALGYIPDFSFVLQDVEDDEKEYILMSHSERLAIAYGIISGPAKMPIRIFKNLRVCGDCHNAIKLISKITEREIIMRDSNRFHHIKGGICSCGDYW